MSQCTKSLLADYVAFSEANYIYPSYTLPGNNFFRTIKKNPYYLANDLRNLALAASTAMKEFDSAPTASALPETKLDWANHSNDKSIVLHSSASKSTVGPYFDTLNNKSGLQILYTYKSAVKLVPDAQATDDFVIATFNLDAVPSAFVDNVLKYVDTKGTGDCSTDCPVITPYCVSPPSAFEPCKTDEYRPGFSGVIRIKEKGSATEKTVDLAKAKPLYPPTKVCPDPADPVAYAILGNKLYFAVKIDAGKEYDEVKAEFTATIIEEKRTSIIAPLL